MDLSHEQRRGLNIALNESNLLGFEVDPERRLAAATFMVLTLPEVGPVPSDRRVQILFRPVGRIAATFRRRESEGSPWNVVTLGTDELLGVVQGFGSPSVRGWDFIDADEAEPDGSEWRRSLDWQSGRDGRSHSISVGLSVHDAALRLVVWFDDLEVRRPTGAPVELASFIADGRRWWNRFHAGDERTLGFGMAPGRPPGGGGFSCPVCSGPVVVEDEATRARCPSCGADFRHHR